MKSACRYMAMSIIFTWAASAFAAELPKEGSYDYISCGSGVANPITFSKTHTASSWESTGSNRSNPPGGLFDKSTYRCVGMTASLDGKTTASAVCESIDPDGDKRLSSFSTADGKTTRTQVTGTGKWEGIVMTQLSFEPLGPFPTIKEGTFQSCNHQKGTYS